jgi:microcystin-dependent protein
MLAQGNPPVAPLPIHPATVSSSGGGAHNNMQPFSVLNFCISLIGLYPSRS